MKTETKIAATLLLIAADILVILYVMVGRWL
jgi:hypothetical protein